MLPNFRFARNGQIILHARDGVVIRIGGNEFLIGWDRIQRDRLFVSLIARKRLYRFVAKFDVEHLGLHFGIGQRRDG